MRRKKCTKLKWIIFVLTCIIVGILMYQKNQKVTVCLDAGHGGNDAGSIATDTKRQEKQDTLEVVFKVKQYLEEQDVKVILTRKEDTYVSLEKRCKIANRKKADLFVSIHRNSSETQKANGIEIWISKEADAVSEKLARDMMEQLENTTLQSNRGIKEGTSENTQTDYYVNKNTRMPSCLVELGFISNPKDNQLLDENIDQYAKAIAEGILENVKK